MDSNVYSVVLKRMDEGAPLDVDIDSILLLGTADLSTEAEVTQGEGIYRVEIFENKIFEKFSGKYIVVIEDGKTKDLKISEKIGGKTQLEFSNYPLDEIRTELSKLIVKSYLNAMRVPES